MRDKLYARIRGLLSTATYLCALGALLGSGAAAAAGLEYNIDRMGSDYRNFWLQYPDPNQCQAACSRENQCQAWTYVKPGVQGPQARCWLKNRVPRASSSGCCVSGVKTGGSETLYVYVTYNSRPATIGVANAYYQEPGWQRLRGPYNSHPSAWREACRLHFQPGYNAPDIVAGRINCATLGVSGGGGGTRTFNNPMVGNVPLDICLRWASSCGKPAADAFCRQNGFSRSINHQVRADSPPTRVIGTGQVCNQSFCDRISQVVCAR